MAPATIMVHVDFDEGAEDRICVAAELAGRFNSLLIGIAGWPLRKYEAAEYSGKELPNEERRQKGIPEQQLERLGQQFGNAPGRIQAGWSGGPLPIFPAKPLPLKRARQTSSSSVEKHYQAMSITPSIPAR